MLWHIAKREIYDNMTSLRFAFTVIMLVSLLAINAATFVRKDYKQNLSRYREETADSLETFRQNCSSLYELMTEGPGKLHKEPSPLTFCADGGERDISDRARPKRFWHFSWSNISGFRYRTKSLWCME